MSLVVQGYCLPPNEEVQIACNCDKLRINERFQTVDFWGKVFGFERDYIILQAKSLNHFEIVSKYFFSDDEGLNFAELPPVEEWMKAKCAAIHTNFTGTQSFVYREDKGTDEDSQENTEEIPEEGPLLTELHRLSWAVQNITHDCFIAPSKSIRLTTEKEFVANVHFPGMAFEEARSLDSYIHLRQPDLKKIYNADAFTETCDVLDRITEDRLHFAWSLYTKGDGSISIRNFLWPGFEFQSKAHSTKFTQGYFGNGLRRNELPWMNTTISE